MLICFANKLVKFKHDWKDLLFIFTATLTTDRTPRPCFTYGSGALPLRRVRFKVGRFF